MLSLRSMPRADDTTSPFENVFGYSTVLLGRLLDGPEVGLNDVLHHLCAKSAVPVSEPPDQPVKPLPPAKACLCTGQDSQEEQPAAVVQRPVPRPLSVEEFCASSAW